MKKKIILFAALLLFNSLETVNAQVQKYSRVKVYGDEKSFVALSKLGICTDHGTLKSGYWFETDLSASEINILSSHGYTYDIIIDNVSKAYVDQNNSGGSPRTERTIGCALPPGYKQPSNFDLGSMAGFFTYQEVLNHLDNMATLFPNLITVKTAMSNLTHESRTVYWVKISDNPNVNDPEPQVLYSAVHHAREPGSVSQLIFYMYYLLENYNSNAEVKYLVDNAEMFFVPIVNPDGYVYNETTAPNGGGMWRKNRRDNGDGTFGVDLNRNYSYNWGANNTGSSPNTGNDTYRGPSAASEPETKNMETFCNQHNFKIAVNYHTYGNLLIYPWGGGTPAYTVDSAQFTTYGAHLTTYNHWSYGTAAQTVLYTTNGTSDDWMYGEQTSHPKIMAMTPEAGKSDEGFWPPDYRIIPICQDAVWTNLHICHLALKYAVAKDNEQNYLPNLTGYFNYKLQRLGMDGPATYSVSIIPISPQITSVGATKVYSSLNLMQEESDSISYTLSGTTPNGQLIKYVIAVDNGSYVIQDTIVKRYGKPVIVFSSAGNSMTGWSSTTGWGVSTAKFHSSPSSITDSPSGKYSNYGNTSIRTTALLDLSNAISAQLTFWAMWDIETNNDYLEVQASNDNGSSWTPLCGKFTKTGNGNQDPDQPLYDAFIKSWLYEEMPLDDYVGQKILIRFNLITDNAGTYDGFYFDDLKVEKIITIPQGINENSQNGFVLSQNMPNPAKNEIAVAYSLPSTISDASMQFFNSIGELVKEQQLSRTAGIAIIDISSFAKGIYFYRIKTEKLSSSVLKMVVIK